MDDINNTEITRDQPATPPLPPIQDMYREQSDGRIVEQTNFAKTFSFIILGLLIVVGSTFAVMKFTIKQTAVVESTTSEPTTSSASQSTDDILKVPVATPNPPGFTEIKTGQLGAGESISLPIEIESENVANFFLSSSGAVPTLTITRPDNQIIDESYALKYPDQVKYLLADATSVTPAMANYAITLTKVGTWKMNITATEPTDYRAFAIINSELSLKAELNKSAYAIGETATINAYLKPSKQIERAAIKATITKPNSKTEVINLIDQGNGKFSAPYKIPTLSGIMEVSILASGLKDGKAFTRQSATTASINAQKARFTGVYSAKPIDLDGDGLYDYLNFRFEVESDMKGKYGISAELNAGAVNITQRGDFFDLVQGKQTLNLSFYGNDILESELDGPYTITSVYLTPNDTGITIERKDDVLKTAAYKFAQFKTSE